jgi:hypothetical protein
LAELGIATIEEGGVGEQGVVDHLADFEWGLEEGNHRPGRGDGLRRFLFKASRWRGKVYSSPYLGQPPNSPTDEVKDFSVRRGIKTHWKLVHAFKLERFLVVFARRPVWVI